MIIINKPTQIDNETLLTELGFNNLTRIEDEPFEVAINPDDNKVYIGSYKNNLLVCASGLKDQLLRLQSVPSVRLNVQSFPNLRQQKE